MVGWMADIEELQEEIRQLKDKLYNRGKDEVSLGPIYMDPKYHRVVIEGTEVHFTKSEYKILYTLLRNPYRVYTRDNILDLLELEHATDRAIDAHIKRIRDKIKGAKPGFNPITTIYGEGYKYNPEGVTK